MIYMIYKLCSTGMSVSLTLLSDSKLRIVSALK